MTLTACCGYVCLACVSLEVLDFLDCRVLVLPSSLRAPQKLFVFHLSCFFCVRPVVTLYKVFHVGLEPKVL
jgi:hypothetical protein